MATRTLAPGLIIQEKQQISAGNVKNLYPITRAQNVFMSDTYDLETTIGNIENDISDVEANYTPKAWLGVASNVEANITGVATLDANGKLLNSQLATATNAVTGGVKIVNALPASDTDDTDDTAASVKLARSLKGDITTLANDVSTNYAKLSQIGANASGTTKGIAELDTSGLVPTTQLPTATNAAQGAVKIVNALPASSTDDADDTAASVKLARTLQGEIDDVAANYTPRAWLGVASNATEGITGVSTLDENGKVYASQLPSFVDDIVDANMGAPVQGVITTATYAHDDEFGHHAGDTIVPESSKIYLDVSTNNTYRWSTDRYVLISESLALGTTHTTAYYGDYGQVAYRHAMNLDTSTGEQETNHNPHNLNSTDIATILGYTPVAPTDMVSTTANGLFSSTDYAKFQNTQEIFVSATAPTFASGSGLWFEVVEDETVTP